MLGMASQAVMMGQPIVASRLIQSVEAHAPIGDLIALLVGLAAVSAAAISVQQLLLGRLGERIVAEVRRTLLAGFFAMPVLRRERRPPGWYSARITNDPPLIRAAVSDTLVQGVQSLLLVAGSLVALGLIDAVTLAAALGFAAAAFLAVAVNARKIRSLRNTIQEEVSNLTVGIQGAARAMRIVSAYRADGVFRTSLEKSVRAAQRLGVALTKIYSRIGPISSLLMEFAYASAVLVGALRVATDHLDFSSLIAFLMYLSMFSSGVSAVSAAYASFQEGVAGAIRISELEREMTGPRGDSSPASRRSTASACSGGAPSRGLVVQDVWYRYPDSGWVLRGVDLHAEPGQMTAIVGSSGSGKSTLMALMEGFFLPQIGSIQVNGLPLSRETVDEIRGHLGFMDQEATIVRGTVRSNLTFGREDVREERMHEILRLVGLHNLARSGDAGLDLRIEDDGAPLSGGQRQRLSLGRALLEPRGVLLLDEPTSSLDGSSEVKVCELLKDAAPESAILVSAHRLSTILAADRIVVLDGGRVSCAGTHTSLLSTSEVYRELTRSQRGL
ncbi:MAG: ABC transporter ATP-binding protein/permease [Bifidobacteriaceae bacterium]|jgi:ABC-type multidrug transport system fused ATPase/permease subunit|nr:ABC transporter ATP-binding protein/permease [Bifidobacteriaceae bacterium]